jgi:hypothetical protein
LEFEWISVNAKAKEWEWGEPTFSSKVMLNFENSYKHCIKKSQFCCHFWYFSLKSGNWKKGFIYLKIRIIKNVYHSKTKTHLVYLTLIIDKKIIISLIRSKFGSKWVIATLLTLLKVYKFFHNFIIRIDERNSNDRNRKTATRDRVINRTEAPNIWTTTTMRLRMRMMRWLI